MSHEKIKHISIIRDKIMITSAPSNEWPLQYREWEAKRLSLILQTEGVRAVEKEILFNYFSGTMQGGRRFTAAIRLAEKAGIITDHYGQYLRCCENETYRDQFLQLLYNFLPSQDSQYTVSNRTNEIQQQLFQ